MSLLTLLTDFGTADYYVAAVKGTVLRLAPGTVWYALYAGSTQIGNAGITLDTLPSGYLVSQTVVLETRNGAGLARSTRLSKAWLGSAVNVERVESRFSREGQQTDWSVSFEAMRMRSISSALFTVRS